MSHEGVPYHVNSSKNPFPFWFPKASKRSADKLSHGDCRDHLRGEAALFVVNTPKRRVHEIVFDIDDVDADKPCDGFAVAEEVRRAFIPPGAEVFVEPSRHRRGAYLRMLVKRTSQPEEFNRLLMDVCRSIQGRHNEAFVERFNARVCGIKGTVWYRFDNPKFDPALYGLQGEEYEREKKTYFQHFEPVLSLERYRYSRGVLVTAACFGCLQDGPERYQQYLEWASWKKGKQVVAEGHLRAWLTANPAPAKTRSSKATEREEEERGEEEINSICQIHEGLCEKHDPLGDEGGRFEAGEGASGERHGGQDSDLVPLAATPDAWKRSTGCYKRLCRFLSRAATFEELWEAYHGQGLNTGGDVDDRRRVRLRKVADIYSVTFDESRSQGGGFHRRVTALLALVRERVTTEHRAGVKYKNGISDIDLAVGLYVVEVNAFELHRDPDLRYTCGNEAFGGMFFALSGKQVIGKRACGREKAGALKRVLEAAGLIQCLDRKWVPKGLSKRGKGTSQKWGPGVGHPRHGEFQFVLKHQPVVRVGVRAAAACEPEDVLW